MYNKYNTVNAQCNCKQPLQLIATAWFAKTCHWNMHSALEMWTCSKSRRMFSTWLRQPGVTRGYISYILTGWQERHHPDCKILVQLPLEVFPRNKWRKKITLEPVHPGSPHVSGWAEFFVSQLITGDRGNELHMVMSLKLCVNVCMTYLHGTGQLFWRSTILKVRDRDRVRVSSVRFRVRVSEPLEQQTAIT